MLLVLALLALTLQLASTLTFTSRPLSVLRGGTEVDPVLHDFRASLAKIREDAVREFEKDFGRDEDDAPLPDIEGVTSEEEEESESEEDEVEKVAVEEEASEAEASEEEANISEEEANISEEEANISEEVEASEESTEESSTSSTEEEESVSSEDSSEASSEDPLTASLLRKTEEAPRNIVLRSIDALFGGVWQMIAFWVILSLVFG